LGILAEKVDVQMLRGAYDADLRGMCATADIDNDEALIEVPAEHVLQVATGEGCPLGNRVQAECWRDLQWWAQLAVLLVYEVQRGSASPLAPWVDSLPRDFASLPLNWSDAELEGLAYPALRADVRKQRDELAQAFAAAARGCDFELPEEDFIWAVQVVRSRAFSGPYEGRKSDDRLVQLALIASLLVGGVGSGQVSVESGLNGAFVAALAIPLTDFFVGASAKLKRHVVCPVVDYLNHDSKVSSDIAYEYFADKFAVRVIGGFRAGEQACINYGESRSNDALLQYYGFVERDNPHDTYELEILQHLDAEAAAAGEVLQVTLSRKGPDGSSLAKLRHLLADEAECGGRKPAEMTEPLSLANEKLVWRAVTLGCEAELDVLSQKVAAPMDEVGLTAQRFREEKRKVLTACRAHAQARFCRPSSPAPLSLATGKVVLPMFEGSSSWSHEWADRLLAPAHAAALRDVGYTVVPEAFDAGLAARCLEECGKLDAASRATVTTNSCNSGSRSLWLEFDSAARREALQSEYPALYELSRMLAGLPKRTEELGALGSGLQVHPAVMVAMYPEQGAEYAVHKDSYAPRDNDPATGATRRLTVLAYLNDWHECDGGELRLHESPGDRPDSRRFEAVAPTAGKVVLFDSPRVWHAVAPSQRGDRWAVTLWVH